MVAVATVFQPFDQRMGLDSRGNPLYDGLAHTFYVPVQAGRGGLAGDGATPQPQHSRGAATMQRPSDCVECVHRNECPVAQRITVVTALLAQLEQEMQALVAAVPHALCLPSCQPGLEAILEIPDLAADR